MKRIWKKSAVIASQIKDLLTSFPAENSRMKKTLFAALAVMVLAAGFAVCQEKKVFNDTVGIVDKFLQRGRYIKIYSEEDMDCIYIVATIIQGIEVENDGFSVGWDSGSQEFPFSECSISLDSECNIIITPKK